MDPEYILRNKVSGIICGPYRTRKIAIAKRDNAKHPDQWALELLTAAEAASAAQETTS